MQDTGDLKARFLAQPFAFLSASEMRAWLQDLGGLPDWKAFADSWSDLPEDAFMADGGRYRQRRHAVFAGEPTGPLQPKEAQPHYQSRDRNPLNGGIERWFEPVLPATADSQALASIFGLCQSWLRSLRPEVERWHVEMHQFRILANRSSQGLPTPEGMHRDGVDFALVLLIQRENVIQGTTSISDLDKNPIGEFTLAEPLDAAVVDDRYAFHGVTPIQALQADQAAFRDVLVLTWKEA